MAKRPIYRLRSIECDSQGGYYSEDAGYGFSTPELAGRKCKVVELRIPDLLDDGDVIVVSAKMSKHGGRSMAYLLYSADTPAQGSMGDEPYPLGAIMPFPDGSESA